MRNIRISDEKDTRELGLAIAEDLKIGDVLGLFGDLGTGKTTLVRYIAEGLGVKETITSPTFTIVKEYDSGRIPCFHFDVYRLESGEEFLDIGGDEYRERGVCLIEWADKIAEVLPDDTKCVFLEYGEKEGERLAKCTF